MAASTTGTSAHPTPPRRGPSCGSRCACSRFEGRSRSGVARWSAMRRDELAWQVPALLRGLPARVQPWLRSLGARRAYAFLDEEELRASRRSDTVFIFGSGSSLNEIPDLEWRQFERHDTL